MYMRYVYVYVYMYIYIRYEKHLRSSYDTVVYR